MNNAEKRKRADLMALYDSLNELNKTRLEERALILLEQQQANRRTVVNFRPQRQTEKGAKQNGFIYSPQK